MLVGYRTIIMGLLVAIGPSALQYLTGVDFTKMLGPTWGPVAAGVIMILMRLVTKTPVGVK